MLPTGTRGKIMAVSLLLIPLLVLVKFVFAPLLNSYFSVEDDIESVREEIQRLQKIIAARPAVEASMQSFEQEQPLKPFLLSGRNAALAAARLQRLLQNIAEEHGIRIVSSRVQPPIVDGPLERISVQVRFSADLLGLRNALYDLEGSRPYLFIDNLTVTARARRRGADSQELEVRMSISGLRSPDSTAESANG